MNSHRAKKNKPPSTLIIGSSGFVGGYYTDKSRHARLQTTLLTPTHTDLDITDKKSVFTYFSNMRPRYLVNFAATTNMDESEKERNDKEGKTWRNNVIGVKNLVAACRSFHTFLIQISTDAVFSGTDQYPGPYKESDIPQKNGKGLNWYGCTKLMAENEIMKLKKRYAIIRISHPFGNPTSERDLVNKTIKDIRSAHLLFADQLFTPTYLKDLTNAIWKIQLGELSGIFHVGCRGLVARIEFDRYLAKKLSLKEQLRVGSLKEFVSVPHRAPRTRLGGFITSQTQQILGLKFHSWQNALDEILRSV